MQLSPTTQKLIRAVPNIALKAAGNTDVQLFLEHTANTGIERVLTEFSARVCYNSVKKMGSAPNFVNKVLQSGHLSTAEHASLMMPVGAVTGKGKEAFSARKLFEVNRYFDFPFKFVAGNMRSWFELMATGEQHPSLEYVVALFPDAFTSGSYVNETELYEFAIQSPVNVPNVERENGLNVYLLAVNLGELAVSHRPDTVLKAPWVRFSWLIEGVSRSLTHQLVRHRGFSFSQESQRYVDFSKKGAFVYPESFDIDERQLLHFNYDDTLDYYERWRTSGKTKEDARFILPNGAATRIVASCNMRELLHFLDIRMAKGAQWEIRRLAHAMAQQAYAATQRAEIAALLEKHDEREGKGEIGSD